VSGSFFDWKILQSWTFVLYFRRLWVVPGSMQSCRQGARHAVNEKNMCFSDGEVQLKYWKEAAVGAFMAVAASGASAATCGPATGDTKTVTVTSGSATVECYAYGSGNINGNVKQDPILNGQTTGKNTFTLVSGPVITGLTFLDNTSESGGAKDGGVTSNGSSTVGQSVFGKVTVGDVSPYSGLILALKIGNKTSLSWAAFKISTDGIFDFVITPKQGSGLSHANLYGIPKLAPVPLPASALLLMGGLGGFAALRRRKKA
jgi:hypothetical protein